MGESKHPRDQLKCKYECLICCASFRSPQSLLSHHEIHEEKAILALPVQTTANTSISNQQATHHAQVARKRQIHEPTQRAKEVMDGQRTVIPVPSRNSTKRKPAQMAMKHDCDSSREGSSDAVHRKLTVKQQPDREVSYPLTQQSEWHHPCLMNCTSLKHGKITTTSTTRIAGPGLREKKKATQGKKESERSSDLPLNSGVMKDGLDWSTKGHGYVSCNNLLKKQHDPEVVNPRAHYTEGFHPCILESSQLKLKEPEASPDLKRHGFDCSREGQSCSEFSNLRMKQFRPEVSFPESNQIEQHHPCLMELRQFQQGQNKQEESANLGLNSRAMKQSFEWPEEGSNYSAGRNLHKNQLNPEASSTQAYQTVSFMEYRQSWQRKKEPEVCTNPTLNSSEMKNVFDWPTKGHSYAECSCMEMTQLDPEVYILDTQTQEYLPYFAELKKSAEGQKKPEVSTELSLNSRAVKHGLDWLQRGQSYAGSSNLHMKQLGPMVFLQFTHQTGDPHPTDLRQAEQGKKDSEVNWEHEFDWSKERKSYDGPSNLRKQLDSEIAFLQMLQSKDNWRCSCLMEIINSLKHEGVKNSSASKVTIPELMEHGQAEQGQAEPEPSTSNRKVVDLTLRL